MWICVFLARCALCVTSNLVGFRSPPIFLCLIWFIKNMLQSKWKTNKQANRQTYAINFFPLACSLRQMTIFILTVICCVIYLLISNLECYKSVSAIYNAHDSRTQFSLTLCLCFLPFWLYKCNILHSYGLITIVILFIHFALQRQ